MAQSTIKTTATQRKLEAKALAAKSKSEGMRMLFTAGYSVTRVSQVFGVGYPFAYGVAKRAGFAVTAAARRPIKAVATKVAKVTKVAKATVAKARASRTTKAAPAKATSRRRTATA